MQLLVGVDRYRPDEIILSQDPMFGLMQFRSIPSIGSSVNHEKKFPKHNAQWLEESWVNEEIETDEKEKLQKLNSQLLLPIGAKNQLSGVLSLSPKLSEQPFTPNDLRLLKSVALQTGLALENSRLTEAIELSESDVISSARSDKWSIRVPRASLGTAMDRRAKAGMGRAVFLFGLGEGGVQQ